MTSGSEPKLAVTVIDRPDLGRFEAVVDDGVAGYAFYERRGETFVFTHTEVDDSYEGKGVGGALARGALDDVRARGGRVIPLCPFIAGYIRRHPEYEDLVESWS